MSFPPDEDVFPLAKPEIKGDEGYSEKPYLCPANKWTIGWGSTQYPDGRAVLMTDKAIEQSFAEVCLTSAMRRKREALEPCVTRTPSLHQAAALISLAYNVGVGAHDGIKGDLSDSTLLEKFNAGDFEGAGDQFLLWNKAHVNGKLSELAGLTTRRQRERTLFLTAD